MPLPIQQNLAQLNWTVRPIGEGGDLSHVPAGFPTNPIRANVPGCIHTDLIDAGLIRDPRVGDAETEIQWVSWTDWRYDAEFDADGALLEREEIDLLFEHLDTIAAVELNGVEVGRASSEFLPWRFSVLGVLAPGRNRIAVTFTSPLRYVKAEAARLGARPVNGDYPAYNMIRKCASNFDWDWGPRVATCGIAGEVRLEGWSYARIAQVSPRWDSEARCRVVVGVQLSGRGMHLPIEVCGSVLLASRGDRPTSRGLEPFLRSANQDVWALDIETSGTDPWSPAGYGSQNRLPLDVELRLRGRVLDRWQQLSRKA